jgi:hypothetical protein
MPPVYPLSADKLPRTYTTSNPLFSKELIEPTRNLRRLAV